MNTKVLGTTKEDLMCAAGLLQENETVIFPTETVYGLGANALDPKAAEKIFSAKGRPGDNPLIVHIADKEVLNSLVDEIPPLADTLMEKFWPGPLTLIFKKSAAVPNTVTGGLSTVAVRMPAHPVALELLTYAGLPIAAPSANLSGKPSPTNFTHVKEDMDGRVAAIIDGGDCEVGVESTVLDVSTCPPTLYRPGKVTVEELEACIGPIQLATALKKGETPKSPGLKYRHYAPEAQVQILHGSLEETYSYIENMAQNHKVGVLVFDEFPPFAENVITISLGSKSKPVQAANRLFSALRQMDAQGVSYIFAPEIPEKGVWRAVRNRLYRAAGENILNLSQKHFLFLCTGNTCRSPMAEGLFRKMAEEKGADFAAQSAGFGASGLFASYHAISVLREEGINLEEHRSQTVSQELIAWADVILTMTKAHRDMLKMTFPESEGKTMTLSQWAGEDGDVKDPYGGTEEDYRLCKNEIKNLLENGWRRQL